jgi:hypothetical protein
MNLHQTNIEQLFYFESVLSKHFFLLFTIKYRIRITWYLPCKWVWGNAVTIVIPLGGKSYNKSYFIEILNQFQKHTELALRRR